MKGQVTEMKRNIKRFLIFMMAVSVTVAGSVTVHATEPEQATGTGELEGSVPTDIFQVILPTSADDVFDFILDPQRLINETDGAAYGGKKFEENATLFFKRTDDETGNDYSSTSDAITIINKSSVPVNVTLTASVSEDSLGGIAMTDDETFTEDTSASMYLALTDGDNTVPIPGEESTSIQMTIPAAEGAYEYRYDSEKDQYTYELKEDLSGIEFPEYSFRLVGAANRNGNWQEIGAAKPEVVVTWVVTPAEKKEEEPQIVPEEAGAVSEEETSDVPQEKDVSSAEPGIDSVEEDADTSEEVEEDVSGAGLEDIPVSEE